MIGFRDVARQELMEIADADKSLRQAARAQSRPRFIHQVDIVMILLSATREN